MNGRKSQTKKLLILLAAAGLPSVAFLWLAAAFAAAPVAQPKVPNPHWKPDACSACHKMDGDNALPIDRKASDDLCLKCHDGQKASAEFHPIGRKFDHEKYTNPPNWPLVDERLACISCHDVRLACGKTAMRTVANRLLLRDYQLGRSQSKPFCKNCHQESAYKKINPHDMLLVEKNEIVEDKCLFCHNKPLDRTAKTRTGNASLKFDETTLCRDCHPQHRDPMTRGHLGIKLSDATLATMAAREVLGLQGKIPEKLVSAPQGAKPTKMVGDANNRIQCTTCHNPHRYGVFPPDSALSYRAMRPNPEGKLISPVRGQAWCRHCHEF